MRRYLAAAPLALCAATAAAPLEDAERALKDHVASDHRARNKAFYDLMGYAETASDYASMLPYVDVASTALTLVMTPARMALGDSLMGSIRKEPDRAMGRVLYSALERAIGKDFATIRDDTPLKQLSEKYKVAEKLRDWAKDPKLMPAEAAALVRLSDGISGSLAKLALVRKPEHTPTKPRSVKEFAAEQVQAEAAIERMDKDLGAVEARYLELQKLLEASKAATWSADRLDQLSFGEKVVLARGCAGSADPQCGGLTGEQRAGLIARDEIRIVAEQVGEATSVYLKGSLAIASNLGLQVPDWLTKGVSGAEAASEIVAGAVSGRPDRVLGGLVGMSGLFGKARPSPDSLILAGIARIEKRLQAIEQHLVVIDVKLDAVIAQQREILQALAALTEKVENLTKVVEDVATAITAVLGKDLKSCNQSFFTKEEVGELSAFMDQTRITAAADRNFTASANKSTRAACQRGVLDALSPQPEPALFLLPRPGDTTTREAQAGTVLAHAKHLAGAATATGGGAAALLPLVIAPSASRVDLVYRFAQRATVTWDDQHATETWLGQPVKLLSLQRITSVAPFAALFHDLRDPSQAPLLWFEAIRNTQMLLGRFVFQRVVFGTDALGALLAVRVVEGLPQAATVVPRVLSDVWRQSLVEPVSDREQRFVGDLLDAALIADLGQSAGVRVARGTIARAWRSDRFYTLTTALGYTGAKTAAMFEARVAGGAQAQLVICVKGGVLAAELASFTSRCLSLAAFERRDELVEPSEAHVARWWIRLLARADERTVSGTP